MDEKLTETIKRRYNRTAYLFDLMELMSAPMQALAPDKARKKLFAKVRGNVLEVGVGTGKNLRYYPPDCTVTAIDFSPNMLARAKKKLGEAKAPVTLLEMDAQAMTFPDNTFDTVVATCVFCSVPDAILGLQEIKRVCKPDGRVLLLEHMRLDKPVIGPLMDSLNPLVVRLVGANINRRTVENVRKAGLTIISVENVMGDLVKLIEARP
ncbi:MAG: methyltransferase domain-containing protein [Clostridia bacterium]|nr:methyltransferase domain-containing protein [Clostridia bacterium]